MTASMWFVFGMLAGMFAALIGVLAWWFWDRRRK